MKKFYDPRGLAIAFVASLMLPVVILTYTEHNPLWVSIIAILLPLGFYTAFAGLFRRSGRAVWWGLPFIFLSAFQVVLSYLFGNSVVATDMFLNLSTTNSAEAGELLSNIYPSIIAVCIIYLPLLWIATRHLLQGLRLGRCARRRMIVGGVATMALGTALLIGIYRDRATSIVRDEVFPSNVIYNMGLAASESHKIKNYPQTSHSFSYDAKCESHSSEREVYVMVIGEASRAANWQLYGYHRPTTPRLAVRNDICLFQGITTQSNTTHKSVPMMLSSVHTSQHDELYRRKGLIALFNEAGFSTHFLSTQARQGAMIDNLAAEADNVIYIAPPAHDELLIKELQRVLAEDTSPRILVVLHTYGSHFSYHQRYPRTMAHFMPDDDVAISPSNKHMICNAYDNSILYTDYILDSIISLLERADICSAIYYCADHGEDLLDGRDERFLHASPTTTYWQLHVASLAWFSPRYRSLYPAKAEAAKANEGAAATTYSVFHTLADMASIASPYVLDRASLVSFYFDHATRRYYLNDHNRAVPLDQEIGIDEEQKRLFRAANVKL